MPGRDGAGPLGGGSGTGKGMGRGGGQGRMGGNRPVQVWRKLRMPIVNYLCRIE